MQDRKSELEEKKRMEVEEKCAIDWIIYNACWSTKQNQKNITFCSCNTKKASSAQYSMAIFEPK